MAQTKLQRVDLGDDFPDSSNDPVEYADVGLIYGERFRISKNVNLFIALAAESDPAEYATLIMEAVHPEDLQRFMRLIRKQRSLSDPQNLVKLVNRLLEAASANPPTSSGESSAGTRKRAAARR